MATAPDRSDSTLTLTVDINNPIAPWPHRQRDHCGQHRLPSRSIRCAGVFGTAIAHPGWLPFADETFRDVRLIDQLEYVRREEDLLAEIGRVLQPGGKLTLRVPATGPLAGFDSLNLNRYLNDITRRGLRPAETWEIGWRKHYPEAELRAMMAKTGLSVESLTRTRFVVSEMLDLSARLFFRWASDNEAAFNQVQKRIDRTRRLEDRLRLGSGFLVTVVAVKDGSG